MNTATQITAPFKTLSGLHRLHATQTPNLRNREAWDVTYSNELSNKTRAMWSEINEAYRLGHGGMFGGMKMFSKLMDGARG